MVKSKPEFEVGESQVKAETVTLVPSFEKKLDKTLGKTDVQEISDNEKEIITDICPHYFILKDRYAEYKDPDPEEKNPIGFPLRINRVHELAGFEATLSQADLSKPVDVFPTRLIKTFVYNEKYQREPFLIVDKRVTGIDSQGRSTNICGIRTGYYKYPQQFEQNADGSWRPVFNQMKKIYDTQFKKETALKFANVGNPYVKKYVVWHPDGIRRGHFTLEEFINLSDQEQLSLIEQGKR